MKRDAPVYKLTLADFSLLLLLVLATWIAFGILRPYFDAILIAALFAVIVNPLYQRLLSLLHNRSSLAAFLMSLFVTALVVIPCILVIWRLWQETIGLLQGMEQWLSSDSINQFMKKPIVMRIITAVNRYIAEFSELTSGQTGQEMQINQMAISIVTSTAKRLADQGSYIVLHAVSLIVNLVLMIFVFFFIIRDQEKLRRTIFRLLPFTKGYEDDVCISIVSITRSTFLGICLTAIAQGIGAAIGFWIVGIPAFSLAVVTAFASLIPVVGTGVVWLPITLYLLYTNQVGSALFVSFWWAVVVVFLLDYLLRPLIMSGRAEMSVPLVLLFIIGGVHMFGLLGVLYGPLILGTIYVLIDLYDLTIAA